MTSVGVGCSTIRVWVKPWRDWLPLSSLRGEGGSRGRRRVEPLQSAGPPTPYLSSQLGSYILPIPDPPEPKLSSALSGNV